MLLNNHACGRLIDKLRVGDAHSTGSARVQQRRPRQRRRHVAVAAASDEDAHRDKVKHLTKLFYTSPQQAGSSQQQQQRHARVLAGTHLTGMPLWRVEWAILPGMQEILHVVAPHYVHMFESIFCSKRPWVFGHLYLPGGSKSLGAATHALASGSKAPLVGVLMQVTRAVRLRDGKFLLLATALGRFKVTWCLRELPFSEADVELLEDCEQLEPLSQPATAAVLQAAPDDCSMPDLMSASTAAAQEAAAALHWAWLKGYELKIPAEQEWPGPGPVEGESDMETYHMVQELAAQGVADVIPLPDGVVIGRHNLTQVTVDATAAMQKALQEAAVRLTSSSNSSGSSGGGGGSSSSGSSSGGKPGGSNADDDSSSSVSSVLSSTEGAGGIVSLNTVSERGVGLQAPEAGELTGSHSCGSTEDVLMLEAAVWQQLDILAALSTRVKGRAHALPFGLLQLRPPRPQMSVAAATLLANQQAAARARADEGDSGSSSSQSSSSSSSGVLAAQQEPEMVVQPPAAEVVSDTDDDEDIHTDSSSSSSIEASMSSSSQAESSSSQDRADPSSPQSSSSTPAKSSSPSSSSVSSRSAAGAAADRRQVWSSNSKYAFAASEGMDVYADPLWPPLRRAAKLSWAAALVTGDLDLDKGPHTSDLRQALLETSSIACRLRYVLAVLQKHAKVLAALAAVKDVQPDARD